MMRDSYLQFGSPHIGDEEIQEVMDTIKSGWLGTGSKAARFEKAFADYTGAEYCLAVNSCTAALHLSLLALGIKEGDEVIVPAMTFCATANAVIHTGATPVFADVKLPEQTLDPENVKTRITSRTKAIIPVHIHGYPVEMNPIIDIARANNLSIISDAAHAIETRYRGSSIAKYGDLVCYSFYITKNLTTVEGGMVATDNAAWAETIKVFALHGMSADAWGRHSDEGYRHYQVVVPGYKYNLTDLQASFGLHQLKRIEDNLKRREEIWAAYNLGLAGLPLVLPPDPEDGHRHGRHLYAVRLKEDAGLSRDDLIAALHKRNIGTGVHYRALHLHKYYAERYGYKKGDLPNSELAGETTLSLPLSAGMSDADVGDVVGEVKDILNHR
jgi:dTDP-4-amino-4,6-dideoxygalactose transaminase